MARVSGSAFKSPQNTENPFSPFLSINAANSTTVLRVSPALSPHRSRACSDSERCVP